MATTSKTETGSSGAEKERTGLDVASLRTAIQENLFYRCGNIPRLATASDYYQAGGKQ